MKIKFKEITIRELVKGYKDKGDDGVFGYDGQLDIRPQYQRNFVYDGKQREAVIDTIIKGFPLNVMYWAVQDKGKFEIIDGQQRTISISQYIAGDFSFNHMYFENLQNDEQKKILDYKLMVYECKGEDSKKLEWFKIVNIAGLKLTNQELRNAVYPGPWVTDAKRYFSKIGGAAHGIGGKYLDKSANRQEYLETAIKWISNNNIEDYMGKNQHAPDAKELWNYFQVVMKWVKTVFVEYRKEMKGIDWGSLYEDFKGETFDSAKMEAEVAELMEDEDVSNKKGIYTYVLTREEKYLNIRPFSPKQKREAYERQKGICTICNKYFEMEKMEADHIKPWSKGGETTKENCQMLCKKDNREKAGK